MNILAMVRLWGIQKPSIITIDFADVAAANTLGAAAASDQQLFDQFELTIAKQFDADYYAHEYPDLTSSSASLLRHYCRQGWYEGRNPNPFFDTVAYLDQNSDVELVGINPYFHYLMFGRKEGRAIDPSASPSVRTRLLFGRPITELVDRLRKHVDIAYYLSQFGDGLRPDFDPVAHFAYRGWRQRKSPNPNFDTAGWLASYPLAARYGVNPLLVQLEADDGNFQIGILEGFERAIERVVGADENVVRLDTTIGTLTEAKLPTIGNVISADGDFDRINTAAPGSLAPELRTDFEMNGDPATRTAAEGEQVAAETSAEMALVAGEFSRQYYVATYPDVAAAGVDPLSHFFHTGWREGRSPNETFDTKYYLEVNEDVRNAEINPFWHYLVSGKTEGRLPRRPGGYVRQLIDSAVVPSSRETWVPDYGDRELDNSDFARHLRSELKAARGLVVSLSHDCYLRVVGGTQIFISDEQRKFRDKRFAYLHLSPRIVRMTLSERVPDFMVRVVLNGKLLGLIRIKSICEFFSKNRAKYKFDAFLVVHCLFGFHEAEVIDLRKSIQAARCVYWLHDYSSLCEGFNLLRNDANFCGCPPTESQACRVCVYGTNRGQHRARLDYLFKHVEFDIASPSRYALALWEMSTNLPYRSARVYPHWSLKRKTQSKKEKKRLVPPSVSSSPTTTSVAFVGYASPSKGWPLFCELVRAIKHDQRYKLFHFAARGVASSPDVEFVVAEVQPHNRFATKDALENHQIDIVVVLSPWPETFSFVTFEAIAAGSCIVCLDTSGNVADVVRQLKAGMVLSGLDDLIQFFESGAAIDMVGQRNTQTGYEIQNTGTSATVAGIADLVEGVQSGKPSRSVGSH